MTRAMNASDMNAGSSAYQPRPRKHPRLSKSERRRQRILEIGRAHV